MSLLLRTLSGKNFPFTMLKGQRLNSNISIPSLPECNFKAQNYKGCDYENLIKLRKTYLNPALSSSLYYKDPILIHQGYKQWLWDHKGQRYLDMFAGIVTVSVGHCHPKVNEAAINQLNQLWHTTNIYMYPHIQEYAEKLTSHLPDDLKVCFFCNSGSEANDMAVLMARLYTDAFDIISLRNAYHGCSPHTMGLTALPAWKFALPQAFGIHHAMNPDPYRGIWGGSACRDSPVQTQKKCNCNPDICKATDSYIEQLQELLQYSLPQKKIAGFFAESIQGVGGAVQFTKNYLKKAYDLIRERGGLCIADEVQTGFGRTGKHFWGFQAHGVIPDIVTMAKGIGNGYPLAAVITTPKIAKVLSEKSFFNTFGGNPVACSIGSTVLDIIKEEKLMENSHHVGTHLLNQLVSLRDEFEIVGDVRGKGLMIGVELVTDKKSKTPLSASKILDIFDDCKNMGLLLGRGGSRGHVFRIKPPMCITQEDAEFCASVLRKALSNYTEKNSS